MDNFFKLLQRSDLLVSKVTVRNIINTMLWLTAVISPICFILAAFTDPSIRFYFLMIGIAPVTITIFGFVYCLFTNPDYLRSEQFHIQKYSIETLGEKGVELTEQEISYLKHLSKPTSDKTLTYDQG
ncbi:hypothetical protein KAX97_10400 [candidate division WOR-3 bacterium]|nr:hypothetical protein [candidate division WOR-3 bacterium]